MKIQDQIVTGPQSVGQESKRFPSPSSGPVSRHGIAEAAGGGEPQASSGVILARVNEQMKPRIAIRGSLVVHEPEIPALEQTPLFGKRVVHLAVRQTDVCGPWRAEL